MNNLVTMNVSCFKAYDVRGELGEELNDDIAWRIGVAFGSWLYQENTESDVLTVVVGGDVRETSESLKNSLADGLMAVGVNVVDLGMVGTEEVYFATFFGKYHGGVEVTASHNPINFNGMKFVKSGAKPVSGDTGLREIQQLVEQGVECDQLSRGQLVRKSFLDAYVDHLLSYIDVNHARELRLVVNSGNGVAGRVVDEIEKRFEKQGVPIEFVKIQHDPDGTFPNGIPNPLLPECRSVTSQAVIENNADMGIAWDGDFDRCFFFDEKGNFLEGYYLVGLLAEAFLQKESGAKIIHDPRLTWNTQDVVCRSGGVSVQSKTGHAFIKERMREEDAIYGGEMSAHHYFRDFAYCDSGMIPWLLISELVSVKQETLSVLVQEAQNAYPCSGEINFKVRDVGESMNKIEKHFVRSSGDCEKPIVIEWVDGMSMEFNDWRFNLRGSNTEPLLRLNVESRANPELVVKYSEEIKALLL